ncbi:MAG: plastocyanin/azurin family copper-binding protein [Chloroflexota bacterium]
MKRYIALFAGFALFSLVGLLAACGGGAPEAPEGDPTAPITLDFEGTDIAFDVTSVAVNVNQPVRVRLENLGTLEHSWVLIAGDTDPITATEEDAIQNADSGVIAGGENATFNFTAPSEPGTYIFVCTVEGHAEAGMLGDFVVQ